MPSILERLQSERQARGGEVRIRLLVEAETVFHQYQPGAVIEASDEDAQELIERGKAEKVNEADS